MRHSTNLLADLDQLALYRRRIAELELDIAHYYSVGDGNLHAMSIEAQSYFIVKYSALAAKLYPKGEQ
jgi:hypothetical protein